MEDKLKFGGEEIADEKTGELSEKPRKKRGLEFSDDEPPSDVDATADVPAAEHDGGGDLEAETGEKPAEPVESKLYERESSLQFAKDSKTADAPATPPVKKRSDLIYAANEAAVVVTAVTDQPHTDETENDGITPETDIADDVPVVIDVPADTRADAPESGDPVDTDVPADTPVIEPAGADGGDPDAPPDGGGKPTPKEEKQAAKRDRKISKLEHKIDKYGEKRDKAVSKQPTRKKKVKERVFNEETGKAKTKLRFEETPIPIGEAKWNVPKKQSLPVKSAAALTTAGVNKLHTKVYQIENENVGTQMAHRAELVGESAVRGGKKLIHDTYRHVKNTPYRKAAKFEAKTVKTRMKLDYQKAVRDNPKLKSNPVSRFMQKRKIKKNYADALRKAKKSGETLKKTGSVVTKATQAVTKLIRRNPVFLLKLGLLLILIFSIMSLFTMCISIFSGGGAGVIGSVSYAAKDEDIEQAELNYTEWETDLRLEIQNAETTHSGYDEYRYNIGGIGHDPHTLMAFLTAVYGEFEYADIESVLRGIFDAQYTLSFIPEVEIRTRTVTRTGTDSEGNSYDYEEEEEYEWHILNVVLTSVPFTGIITPMMDDEQKEHFEILAQSLGARQIGGSPFDVMNWLPFVSSYYGYRVHPITGVKDLHRGIDIAMPEGTEIHAGITGTVTVSTYDGGYGNYIVIKSADGVEMKYAHCQTLYYAVGQTVERGDVIATVGNTGSSTGAHLHMEILKDGVYQNPIYYVDTFYY